MYKRQVRCDSQCCSTGDLCISGSCSTPTSSCLDSFDCDEGEFCEPTLGLCLPQPDGEICEVRLENIDLVPSEEWHWSGYSADPNVRNVAVTPAVADIDLDGIPEVAFAAYPASSAQAAMLVVVSGETGVEELTIPSSDLKLAMWSGVALGNLDSDPELEIVVVESGPNITVLEHDGTRKWSQSVTGVYGYPSLVNLDTDPESEIVFSGTRIDNNGDVLHAGGPLGCNGNWCISAVADVDGDGFPELIGGKGAFNSAGANLWAQPGADGFPAVADMDLDSDPDVVVVSSGSVRVHDAATGTVIFGPVPIPGGGSGGAPTIADFDGDGRPEFSTAGRGIYAVYDLDCLTGTDPAFCSSLRTDGILWEQPTQDLSSSITGSSVFDFEGDGVAEVVYNDECTLRVYSGLDGTELFSRPNSSRTAAEYPLVVDVDGDNNSEFIVPANDDQITRDGCAVGTHGVYAFGDLQDRWVRTRRVWNQHTYHVTNISSEGTVPVLESSNWLSPDLNNFRQNTQGDGTFNAPDLSVAGVSVNLASCPTAATIDATIQNIGSLGAPSGVPVGFYLGTFPTGQLLGFQSTTGSLLPGESENVFLSYPIPAGEEGPWQFYVVADDSAAGVSVQSECDENNNNDGVGIAECGGTVID